MPKTIQSGAIGSLLKGWFSSQEERAGDEGGVYYNFKVEQDKKPKIIQTSAWTLIRELKKTKLKSGMVLDITKKLSKGKQYFEVKEVE